MIRIGHLVVLNSYRAVTLYLLILLDSLVWWLSRNDRVLPGDSKVVAFILVPYLHLFGCFILSIAFVSGFSLRFWLQPGWDWVRGGLKATTFPTAREVTKR